MRRTSIEVDAQQPRNLAQPRVEVTTKSESTEESSRIGNIIHFRGTDAYRRRLTCCSRWAPPSGWPGFEFSHSTCIGFAISWEDGGRRLSVCMRRLWDYYDYWDYGSISWDCDYWCNYNWDYQYGVIGRWRSGQAGIDHRSIRSLRFY